MEIWEEFAAEAKLYYQCGLDADLHVGKFPAYALAAPRPVMLMMAFSIELSLKSFLYERSVSKEDVKNLSHNLVKAWRLCCDHGSKDKISLTDDDLNLLEIISDLHAGMCLRYREPSRLEKLPVFGPLEMLASKFLKLCNAPTLEKIRDINF